MNLPLLILLIPALTGAILFAVPAERSAWVKRISFVSTLTVLVLAAVLAFTFSTTGAPSEVAGTHVYKHVLTVPWVPALGLQLKVGVDGMGVIMVLLTALTIFTGVCVSFSVKERAKRATASGLALRSVAILENFCLASSRLAESLMFRTM